MSVLIKGMEMPKSCHDCGMFALIDVSDGLAHGCRVLKEMIFNNRERLPNCPLIELPQHGDLIDRDDLMSTLLNKTYGVDINVVMKQIMEKIISAPIIIEAEDENADS